MKLIHAEHVGNSVILLIDNGFLFTLYMHLIFTILDSDNLNFLKFQVRLIEYQCGVVKPSVPDYIIKRMYLSNSIVNPLLSIAFYMSGIILKLCKCVKPSNLQQGTNTAVSNY